MAGGSSMRVGVLVAPQRFEIREMPLPKPGPGDALLRVRAALTCGTDLKAYLRGHPKWPMPTPFGHEFAGEIAAVGRGVSGFREGDEVMATPTGPCNRCFWCERNQENLCESLMGEMVLGGYGEYLILPERVLRVNVFAKPKALSFADAALLEPLSCVVFGLEEIPIRPDDTVVLLGGGAIALLHLAVLRARGVEKVWVVARKPQRIAAARELGAARIFETDATAVEPAIREATAGRGADLVVECTGRKEVWEAAPRLARKGGEVVLFGGCPAGTEVTFGATTLHYDQVRLRSPFHFTPRSVRAARELIASGAIRGSVLFTETGGLDGVENALRAMQAGVAIKCVVEP